MLCRGFLLGGTSGRTTLNGEGLQHQDGHSQVIANTVPNLRSYDPAFAYELAVIVRDGIERMYARAGRCLLLHHRFTTRTTRCRRCLTSSRTQTASSAACTASGARPLRPRQGRKAHLFGSGADHDAKCWRRHELLEEAGMAADIWSVTSYNELSREALRVRARQPPVRQGRRSPTCAACCRARTAFSWRPATI